MKPCNDFADDYWSRVALLDERDDPSLRWFRPVCYTGVTGPQISGAHTREYRLPPKNTLHLPSRQKQNPLVTKTASSDYPVLTANLNPASHFSCHSHITTPLPTVHCASLDTYPGSTMRVLPANFGRP